MADESTNDESGSTLRQKLEAALAENQSLKVTLGTTKASQVIQEKGFTHVKPDDLKGVDLEHIEARAEAIQQERQKFLEESLKATFQAQGISDDEELTARVQAVLGPQAAQEVAEAAAYGRVQSVVGGTPAPVVNTNQLHGREAIRAALEQRSKK
jgi:hypothetical protein